MKKLFYSLAILFTLTSAVYADYARPGFENNNSNQRNDIVGRYNYTPQRINHYDNMGRLVGYSMAYTDGTVKEYDSMGRYLGSSK